MKIKYKLNYISELTRLFVLPKYSREISIIVKPSPSSDSNLIVAHSMLHLAVKDKNKRVYKMVARNSNDVAQMLQTRLDLSN